MRRNAIAVVLFALALGLKVLLPAGALAHASPNQATAFQDCSGAIADGAFGHRQTPGKGERHAAGCPLCPISCEGSFALSGRAPLRVPVALFDRGAGPFGSPDSAAPTTRAALAHQPRAPPFL